VLSSSTDWGPSAFSRLQAAVLQRLAGLQHLHLGSGCGIQREAEAQLGQLTCLTYLWVWDLRVEGAAAEAVLPLPQLRELGCAYIAGPAAAAGSAAAGAVLPQLTQLWMGQRRAENEAPSEAMGAAYALCSTRGCLLGLLPLPQLQRLHLTVDDDDWVPLAAELAQQTSLTSLSLQPTETHDELGPLAAVALPQLALLRHLICTEFSLDLACWQAISCMSQLQSLELEQCSMQLPHLSLLHRCAALEEIDLCHCEGVGDEELVVGMLAVKPGLQRLVLQHWCRWEMSRDRWRAGQQEDQRMEELAAFLGVEFQLT
jgi:hypothetical protein